jgi:Predicted Zn-dependent peptidases
MKNNFKVFENTTIGEKYYFLKHKSGLDIYVFPKKLSSSYAVFATRYGAIDNKFKLAGESEFTEVPDGIAHFLEHKMFENEDGVDTFERFAQTGASANAFTSNAQTAYLYACTENFYDSFRILLDYVTHPYFTPENVEKEQGIIAQEIRMYEDSPENRMYYGLMEAMYEKNPMRINIAGTVESISHVTSDILYKCYNTFYALSNMAVAVSGDLDPDMVIDIADEMLANVKDPGKEIICEYESDGETVFKTRSEAKMQVARPIFEIGVKDSVISDNPNERVKKQVTMNILNEILFSRSGRFYNELYEEGLISPNLGYGFYHSKYASFNIISAESDVPEQIYDRFCRYIEEVKRDGVDKKAFERCKRVSYANCVCDFDNTSSIAHQIIDTVFDDFNLFDFPGILSSITFDDVSAMLHSIFKPERYAMSVVYPLDDAANEKGE